MTAMMIEAALRGLVFAAAVGMGLSLLRVSHVPARKAAWSLVLLASMALPFLMRWPAVERLGGRFGWEVPIRVTQMAVSRPTLEAAPAVVLMPDETPTVSVGLTPSRTDLSPATTEDVPFAVPAKTGAAREHHYSWPPPGRRVTMIYLAVSGALLLRLVWGLGVALRLWMTAEMVSPLVAPEPNVRASAKISSPVTIGVGIVLPASYTEWDREKLRIVLAHERSHVRQLDFYLQLLAGIYAAVFWFSPLGWWLRRTLAALGEAMSDRAGIDAATSRAGYAQIVLEFAAMPRQSLPGVAMARSGNLSHRIERLLNEPLFRSAFAEGRRRGLASLLLIPAALFAATVLIRVPVAAAAQAAPVPPVAAQAPVADVAPIVAAPVSAAADSIPAPPAMPDVSADSAQDQAAPVPAPAPQKPSAAIEPVPPAPSADREPAAPLPPGNGSGFGSGDGQAADEYGSTTVTHNHTHNGYGYHFSSNGDSYAIVDGTGKDMTFSEDWSGDQRAQIDAARRMAHGPFLWFRHDGKSYVVDDPAIVARIQAMFRPMEDLGRQQEALGRQQEALGRMQEALARAQREASNIRIPDMTRMMAEVDAALATLKVQEGKELTPEKLADLQAKLAEMQARLGALQGEAGAKQGGFGTQMGELGAKQGALGAQQGWLGAEQGRLAAQADRQVRSIIEESLRNGKATPVQ